MCLNTHMNSKKFGNGVLKMTDVSLQEEVERFVKSSKILKKDFAAQIGIKPMMLSHWLKGRVTLSERTLRRIIAELDK